MRRGRNSHSVPGQAMLLALALSLVLAPSLGRAVDTDLDGFDNTLEGKQIVTMDGLPFTLDATKKDLFVILRPASIGSLFPAQNPLEYLVHPSLSVHQMKQASSTTARKVTTATVPTTNQNAMRITENNTSPLSSDIVLGVCTYGTPNYYDDATVYSLRIKQWIDQKVAGATSVCLGTQCNPPGAPGWLDRIRDVYVKHTIAHEAGHMMKMTNKNDPAVGYHTVLNVTRDPSSPYSLMLPNSSSFITNKNGVVTFTIPTQYPSGMTPTLK
ncbi:MAG: hypothetical protein AB9873_16560 [Syntrophobacteraceae bacterium]